MEALMTSHPRIHFLGRGYLRLKLLLAATCLASLPTTTIAATQDSINIAQQMYVAYYGRPGDPGGVNFWAEKFDASSDLNSVLSNFGNSQEYNDNFGSLSNEELVNGLFQQMFNRDSDSGGLAFYVGRLESGVATLASIAKQIADGSVDSDLVALNNKIEVANSFTDRVELESLSYGSGDIASAQQLLIAVSDALDSVASTLLAITTWVSFVELEFSLNNMDLDNGAFQQLWSDINSINTFAFTITNPSDAAIVISGVSAQDHPDEIAGNFPLTIEAGASQTLELTFGPLESTAEHVTQLSILGENSTVLFEVAFLMKIDNFAGDWLLTVQEEGCGNETNTLTANVVRTFTGDSAVEHQYSLSVSNGLTATNLVSTSGSQLDYEYSVVFPDDGGTTTENGQFQIRQSSTTGTSTWSWESGNDSCSGTSVISGHRV